MHLLRHSTVRFHFYSWKSVDKRLSARGLPLPGVPSGSAQSPDSRSSTCLAMPRSDKVIADRSDVPDEIRPSKLLIASPQKCDRENAIATVAGG